MTPICVPCSDCILRLVKRILGIEPDVDISEFRNKLTDGKLFMDETIEWEEYPSILEMLPENGIAVAMVMNSFTFREDLKASWYIC